jgi:group I intron endonuclease
MAESGIYEIVNRVNGKRYVGSAVNLAHRWRQHRCELAKGRHNPILQNAWNKYGGEAFEFRVIEHVSEPTKLIEREQHFIDCLLPQYNCAKVAGSKLGVKPGKETLAKIAKASKRMWESEGYRQKMSDAHKGRKPTDEQRAKISAALKGRKQSEEHRVKTAERNVTRNRSDEHRALMSTFWKGRAKTPHQIAKMAETKRGSKLSEDHKSKVSSSLKRAYDSGDRVQIISPETRAKISATLKGRTLSIEHVEKMRGRKQSAATIKKRSEALKRAWAEGRHPRSKKARSGESAHEPRLLNHRGEKPRR